ncbi:hypothetical protein CGGC5_v002307 [Colletotrichum fructicola Nara gc5]|uniref:Uncharacterized protein n=1 Tax=Colletotrichum fructicola (strain Nara gc5) TaxID=1213859 RepID=A0A7J6JJ57_COLFN|nr:hypothetical protein CGGC5_v002307 [Colletotrichum fructicola Nara gc5]
MARWKVGGGGKGATRGICSVPADQWRPPEPGTDLLESSNVIQSPSGARKVSQPNGPDARFSSSLERL